ncbi:DNA internalization-related competence protein ComEC/Rec2 [Bacillus sp. REN3]|uniref:DNA internalization-related competence protein ComEC/Rec2 n=1 Tax=Bacillus sp. REN3 TaxID=2802440 RepID=UPI001AEE9A64|nr:DNA internalization-related competence protein ComEC/Rec2 [Bacillus sp. REN3]
MNRVSIKGNLFYFALISLMGLLTVFEDAVLYGGLSFAAILLLKKYKQSPDYFVYLLGACYLTFVVAGFIEEQGAVSSYTGDETVFRFVVKDKMKVDGDIFFAYADTYPEKERIAIRYRIKSKEEKLLIRKMLLPGTACKAEGSLESPSVARNPNAFDYKNYLERQGIYWTFNVESLEPGSCLDASDNTLTKLKRFRQKEITMIEESYPAETAALSIALIFGDRNLINPQTESSYRKIGIIHLLAISGLHIALMAGMFYFLLIRTGLSKEMSELLLILALPVYTVISGLAPPVVRAAGMLILLIGARRFRIKLPPFDAISIAFMLSLIVNPKLVYDTGFQLSFSVSFALIVSAKKILSTFRHYLTQIAAVSFVAQLAAMPIILYSYFELSAISLLANLLFIPLFSFILLPLVLLGYFIFTLTGVPPATFFGLLEKAIHLVNVLSISLSEVPGAMMTIGKPGKMVMISLVAAIWLFFLKWEKIRIQKRQPPPLFYLFPVIPLLLQVAVPYINPYGEIIFLDVGQGDSILIRMPFNKGNYLIDTGGVISFGAEDWKERREGFDPGKDTVLPLLKSKGIRKLDKLILTHGDADHIGGAAALIEEIGIGQIVMPRYVDRSALEEEIIKLARKKKVPLYFGGDGTAWTSPGGKFRLMNPSGENADRNENSIVMLADISGKQWLFTGDLGTEGEAALLRRYPQLGTDVLKVGHHGSKTSTSAGFLDRLRPDYAVISVKKKNRYGHPSSEILDRLRESGIRIYRTDENGAIIYRFKGEIGTFSTQLP